MYRLELQHPTLGVLTYRSATISDIDVIDEMVAFSKAQFKQAGINQWQQGYPARSDWERDVEREQAYVIEHPAHGVLGVQAVIGGADPSYAEIQGGWITPNDEQADTYIALHRVCVSDKARGMGICGLMFKAAEIKGRAEGVTSIRLDTHPENYSMQRVCDKADFQYCGIIHLKGGLEDGAKRIAFEKRIESVTPPSRVEGYPDPNDRAAFTAWARGLDTSGRVACST